MSRFRSSAPKAENGFVAARIVSSPADRRNNQGQIMRFQRLAQITQRPGRDLGHWPAEQMTATRRQSKRVLYVSLVDNHSAAEAAHEPTRRCSRLTGIEQLSAPLRVTSHFDQGWQSWVMATSLLAAKPLPG